MATFQQNHYEEQTRFLSERTKTAWQIVPSTGQLTIPSVLSSKKEGTEEKLQRKVKANGGKGLIKCSQQMTLSL